MPETSELSAKLEQVEALEKQIEDQQFKISQLREEKVCVFYVLCNKHPVQTGLMRTFTSH